MRKEWRLYTFNFSFRRKVNIKGLIDILESSNLTIFSMYDRFAEKRLAVYRMQHKRQELVKECDGYIDVLKSKENQVNIYPRTSV